MANSKAFLLICLILAAVLVVSSEVSARELAETAQTQETAKPNYVEDDKHGHKHHHHRHHHGKPGHGAAGEELEVEN